MGRLRPRRGLQASARGTTSSREGAAAPTPTPSWAWGYVRLSMTDTWDPAMQGVLRLPSGRLLRGRGLRHGEPEPGAVPGFGLYLLGREPGPMAWEARWLCWPDFRLPADRTEAAAAFREAWRRSERERVEVACGGGQGRTGTALACLAILDGVAPGEAVAFVRANYNPRAVETPWQRRYVARFRP